MRAHPPASTNPAEKKRELQSSLCEDRKRKDFLIYMKKSDRLRDFKNTEIELVFLHPLSSAVTSDEEHSDCSPKPRPTQSFSFLQWHSASRRWNSRTNIRDLFLPERAETQQSISTFIFSHSFYFPPVCILYTCLRLCLVKM